jgi:hypothetical protein
MDGTSNNNENTPKTPHPGGRPTKFHKAYIRIAYQLCRQHGYTEEKVAELLGVHLNTLRAWKDRHPEFQVAIRRGKDEFDSENVETALLKRAKGFVRKRLMKKVVKRRGREYTETKEIVEEVAGSVRAQEIWLYNRHPDRWKRIPGQGFADKSPEEIAQQINDMLVGMKDSVPPPPAS